MFNDAEKMLESGIAVLLALFGGVARMLHHKTGTAITSKLIISELMVSGFTGYMALLFARASGLSGDWLGVVCGMAGWSAPRLVDFMMKKIEKLLNLETIKPRTIKAKNTRKEASQ